MDTENKRSIIFSFDSSAPDKCINHRYPSIHAPLPLPQLDSFHCLLCIIKEKCVTVTMNLSVNKMGFFICESTLKSRILKLVVEVAMIPKVVACTLRIIGNRRTDLVNRSILS